MNHWIIIAWSLVAIGAAVAAWAIFSDRARGRRRCPGGWRRVLWVLPVRGGCWYDMGGAIELPATCPECGRTWRREASLRRTRVRYGRLGLAGACVAAAYLASLMPRVDRFGWWSAAPTWALVSFAPMEEFARGSLGCRVSWNMLPGSTAELMEPKWDRPYAPWETAILKWRLERAVDRVRDEFPGRDAAFIPLAKYQSAEWTNVDEASFLMQVRLLDYHLFGTQIPSAHQDKLKLTAGLLVLGGTDRHISVVRLLEPFLGSGTSSTTTGPMRSVGVYDAERSIAAFDLSQLEPLAAVDAWSTTRTASGPQAASLRLASLLAEARVVVTLVCRRLGGAGRAFHERPSVGLLGHLLVVIGSEAEIEATDQFLRAAARCAAAGGAAVEMVPVSHPDTEVRLYSADGIALKPTNMATLPGGSVPMNQLDWAARQVQAQSRAIVMPVGSSLVVIGSREEVAAAGEEIGRLRGASTTGL